MNKRLIELLTAIATDSRVLAEFQNDPNATMAMFGLSDGDMRELIENPHGQSTAESGTVATAVVTVPVTHCQARLAPSPGQAPEA